MVPFWGGSSSKDGADVVVSVVVAMVKVERILCVGARARARSMHWSKFESVVVVVARIWGNNAGRGVCIATPNSKNKQLIACPSI